MTPKAITLRLDTQTAHQLDRQAIREGVPVEAVAARILYEGLFQNRTEALEREVRKLRQNFAAGMQALLVASGRVSADEAKRWVEKIIVSA